MLLDYLGLLSRDPAAWLWLMFVGISGVVIAITVHEAGHAWAAFQLGDRTSYRLGRVSLDPRRHLDPFGTLLFLIASFGWGKPTPVDPGQLRGDRRAGSGMVSVAGPASNLLTAAVLALPLRAGLVDWSFPYRVVGVPRSPAELAGGLLSYAILFNVVLAVFNLIPLPPLDGFKALLAVVPDRLAEGLEKIERFGLLPLFILLVIDIMSPVSIIGSWVIPLANGVGRIVAGHAVY